MIHELYNTQNSNNQKNRKENNDKFFERFFHMHSPFFEGIPFLMHVSFNCLKTLFTDNVFHLAGVLRCDFFRYAKSDKPCGK